MTVLSYRQLLLLAYESASDSIHPSTQVGSLLYYPRFGGGTPYPETAGNNAIPSGLIDSLDRWSSPFMRSQYVEHSERSTIYAAARQGICTDLLGMVATWAACSDCARAIIAAGITEVLTDSRSYERTSPEWRDTVLLGREMMKEAGVKVIDYNGPLIGELRQGGEIVTL